MQMLPGRDGSTARSRRRLDSDTRGVVALTVVIFWTDVVYGMVGPTFSLYARGLGASLELVGALAAIVGATRLVVSFPIGVAADRVGRRAVIVFGVGLFGLASYLFTVSPSPAVLFVPRILFGVAIVSTFPIGVAFIADRRVGRARDLAISAYVAAQGLGFSVGPVIGTAAATRFGFVTTYRIAASTAVVTAFFAWRTLRRPPLHRSPKRGTTSRRLDLRSAAKAVAGGSLASVSAANLVVMLMFSAAVVPFLALQAQAFGFSPIQIGALYAARALTSTLARVPAGLAARRLSSRAIFIAAVVLDAVAALAIGFAQTDATLIVAAMCDGIAFGTFLTASQGYVAETFERTRVGTALGAYGVAGSVGETAGGALMGVIASGLGTSWVFRVSGLLLASGAVVAATTRGRVARHTVVDSRGSLSDPADA